MANGLCCIFIRLPIVMSMEPAFRPLQPLPLRTMRPKSSRSMSLGSVSQRAPMKRDTAPSCSSAAMALTSPISNFVQLVSPVAHFSSPLAPFLTQTGPVTGLLRVAAATQPGQWPNQSATPGTLLPWCRTSQSIACCTLVGAVSATSLASG